MITLVRGHFVRHVAEVGELTAGMYASTVLHASDAAHLAMVPPVSVTFLTPIHLWGPSCSDPCLGIHMARKVFVSCESVKFKSRELPTVQGLPLFESKQKTLEMTGVGLRLHNLDQAYSRHTSATCILGHQGSKLEKAHVVGVRMDAKVTAHAEMWTPFNTSDSERRYS